MFAPQYIQVKNALAKKDTMGKIANLAATIAIQIRAKTAALVESQTQKVTFFYALFIGRVLPKKLL